MTDSAINKKSKRAIWIPLLVLITLAACATAGYSYWRMHQQPSASVSAEPAPPPAPVFFALDTFTVNLGDADRVLYIGVTLRMKDEATRAPERISAGSAEPFAATVLAAECRHARHRTR